MRKVRNYHPTHSCDCQIFKMNQDHILLLITIIQWAVHLRNNFVLRMQCHSTESTWSRHQSSTCTRARLSTWRKLSERSWKLSNWSRHHSSTCARTQPTRRKLSKRSGRLPNRYSSTSERWKRHYFTSERWERHYFTTQWRFVCEQWRLRKRLCSASTS